MGVVRDEIDVIDGLVQHHLAQGAERLIIADNMSVDGTRERLGEWARDDERVTVLDDRLEAFHQDFKVTYLARLAWSSGADWVVPVDADERWMGAAGTLHETLSGARTNVLRAAIHNVYPSEEAGAADSAVARWRVDLAPHPTFHVAFRAHPLAKVSNGSHDVRRPQPSVDDGLHLLHFPWRSREQLARKVAKGALALGAADLGPNVDGHWFTMAQADPDTFDAIWREISGGPVTDLDFGYKPIGPFMPLATTTPRAWYEVLDSA